MLQPVHGEDSKGSKWSWAFRALVTMRTKVTGISKWLATEFCERAATRTHSHVNSERAFPRKYLTTCAAQTLVHQLLLFVWLDCFICFLTFLESKWPAVCELWPVHNEGTLDNERRWAFRTFVRFECVPLSCWNLTMTCHSPCSWMNSHQHISIIYTEEDKINDYNRFLTIDFLLLVVWCHLASILVPRVWTWHLW